MSFRHVTTRTCLAAALAVGLGSAAQPASAADAPSRQINLNAAGRLVDNLDVTGVAVDGRELVLNQFDEIDTSPGATNTGHRVVVRDVAGSKTTVISDAYDRAVAASTDLKRILFSTKRSLSSADTNGTLDYYLHDRVSKVNLLVTRSSTNGPALGVNLITTLPVLSGDGQTVFFSTGGGLSGVAAKKVWRFSAATKAISLEVDNALLSQQVTDSAGHVVLTERGIFRDRVLVPGTERIGTRTHLRAAISPDGSTVLARRHEDDGAAWQIVAPATGVIKPLPLAGPLAGAFYDFLSISADGKSGLVPQAVTPTPDNTWPHTQLWKVDLATGVAAKFGGELESNDTLVVNPDWTFAATGTKLYQLGSTPIPGTATSPVRPPATEYLWFAQGCRANAAQNLPVTRPSLTLAFPSAVPLPNPYPTAVSASVSVKVDATGAIANLFTLTASKSHQLTAGWGGFTYTATVSFSDGTKETFSKSVAPYTPPVCTR